MLCDCPKKDKNPTQTWPQRMAVIPSTQKQPFFSFGVCQLVTSGLLKSPTRARLFPAPTGSKHPSPRKAAASFTSRAWPCQVEPDVPCACLLPCQRLAEFISSPNTKFVCFSPNAHRSWIASAKATPPTHQAQPIRLITHVTGHESFWSHPPFSQHQPTSSPTRPKQPPTPSPCRSALQRSVSLPIPGPHPLSPTHH